MPEYNPGDGGPQKGPTRSIISDLSKYSDVFVGGTVPEELIKDTYFLEKPLSTLEVYNANYRAVGEVESILEGAFFVGKYGYKETQPEEHNELINEGYIDKDKFNGEIVISRFKSIHDVFMDIKPSADMGKCSLNAIIMWPNGATDSGCLDLSEVSEYCGDFR